MKRIVLALLSSAFLLTAMVGCERVPGSVPDENTTPNSEITSTSENSKNQESPVSDFEYVENEDGGITITKYLGSAAQVVIPEYIDHKNVTQIGGWDYMGFEGNVHIRSVVLPDHVRSIGSSAFKDCVNLSEIVFGANLRGIGMSAFLNCTALSRIDLSSEKLIGIDDYAFKGCESLIEVTFGENITFIGQNAFFECKSIKSVQLPKKLERIGEKAFYGCIAIESVTIPKTLTVWGSGCFMNNSSLSQVIYEEGLEEIRDYAFFGNCERITELTIPASVKRIFNTTFWLPNLSKVVFLGDCPIIEDDPEFEANMEIYYYPNTSGWDTFKYKDDCKMIPITQH